MMTSETEIRRLANGAIDTAYYVRHCHRRRSLAAHGAIARVFAAAKTILTGDGHAAGKSALVVEIPAGALEARRAEREDRRAA